MQLAVRHPPCEVFTCPDVVGTGVSVMSEAEKNDQPPPSDAPRPVDPAALKPGPPKTKAPLKGAVVVEAGDAGRRSFIWYSFAGMFAAVLIAFGRFFFPRSLFEPPTKFPIGYPDEYGFGVDTKWQQKYRIWVVRDAAGLYVIYARCTHLGCTPDWKPAENKFKCPCHGSGFDSEGVNFEGPAPYPLLRCALQLDPVGQIVVDTLELARFESFSNPKYILAV